MKVGLIVYGSLEVISGGNLYDQQLVDHLRRSGADVEIFSLKQGTYLQNLMGNARQQLVKQIEDAQIDVLLQDELCHPSLAWLNRRLKAKLSSPIVSIVHHLRTQEAHPVWLNQSIYRIVEQQYLDSVDAFVFNSETTQATVKALSTQQRPSVIAYPCGDRFGAYGLSTKQIQSRAHEPGPLRLLFLGSIIKRKGLHVLIEALAQLRGNTVSLTIAGNKSAQPRYTQQMRKMVSQHQLDTVVSWAGTLLEEQVAQALASHHMLVMPSEYEGFGIAYLEGMAFGLPAIATTAGAAKEIITHGDNGFLITPGDASALARTLNAMVKNRDWLAGLSINAKKRFEAHPSWENSMEKIRQFIEVQVKKSK